MDGMLQGGQLPQVYRTLLLTDQGAERGYFAQALPPHGGCSVDKQGGQIIQTQLELAFPYECWSLKGTLMVSRMVVFDSLEARKLYFKFNPTWNLNVLKTLIL